MWLFKKMEDKKSFVLKEEKETKCHCCCCYNNMFHSLSLLLSDLQFIVRWFNLQSACCFTKPNTFSVYWHILLVVGRWCVSLRLSYGEWNGFVATTSALGCAVGFSVRFLNSWLNLSWGILWFPQCVKLNILLCLRRTNWLHLSQMFGSKWLLDC